MNDNPAPAPPVGGLDENARRRLRYDTDPAYRAKVVDSKRARYRAARLARGESVRDAGKRVKVVHVYGRTRKVEADTPSGTRPALTYSCEELARLLGYHPVVVCAWVREGRLPKGILRNACFPFRPLYSEGQVRHIVRVFAALHQHSQYYYRADTTVRDALFAYVEKVSK